MLLEKNKKGKKAEVATPSLNKTKKPPSKKRKIESDSSEDELKNSSTVSKKATSNGKTKETTKSVSSDSDNNEVSKSADEAIKDKKETAEKGKQNANMFFGMCATFLLQNTLFYRYFQVNRKLQVKNRQQSLMIHNITQQQKSITQ